MELEQAIKTALEYETRVRDLYVEAASQVSDKAAQHVLKTLAREEQYHLDYLTERLHEWQSNRTISPEIVATLVPPLDHIEREVKKLSQNITPRSHELELQMLQKALEVEKETTQFYQSLVESLGGTGQEMFARFVEIEAGHQAIVRAEIDAITGSGFWFDFHEFSREKEL
ncbi:hypothetical protein JXQ70_11245 [bacterium]|nr:hypothetical protein [bacterium]